MPHMSTHCTFTYHCPPATCQVFPPTHAPCHPIPYHTYTFVQTCLALRQCALAATC